MQDEGYMVQMVIILLFPLLLLLLLMPLLVFLLLIMFYRWRFPFPISSVIHHNGSP
jgi:hypothetical protein